jgi:hypothetical protein
MFNMKKWGALAPILLVVSLGIYADCASQSGGVDITVTIPGGLNIHAVEVQFSLLDASQPGATFAVNTAQEDANYDFDAVSPTGNDSHAVPVGGSVDTNTVSMDPSQGYIASVERAGDVCTLKLHKKLEGTDCSHGVVTGSAQVSSWHVRSLSGTYRIACVSVLSYNNCQETFTPWPPPTAVLAPCEVIDSIRIQRSTGTGTGLTSLSTTTDPGDEVTLYACAYSGSTYLGPIPVTWSAGDGFHNSDFYGSTSNSSVIFAPHYAGTGTITASYNYCTGTYAATVGSVTVAGSLDHIVVVDAAYNPINDVPMASSSSLTLQAAGYDSGNRYRKLVNADWFLTAYSGAFYQSDLSPRTYTSTTTFNPYGSAGTLGITANASGRNDSTGTITVTAGTLASIKICNSGGTPLTNVSVAAGDTISLYAFGYDRNQNPLGQQTVHWETIPASTGSFSQATAPSTVYTVAGLPVNINATSTVGGFTATVYLYLSVAPGLPKNLRIRN